MVNDNIDGKQEKERERERDWKQTLKITQSFGISELNINQSHSMESNNSFFVCVCVCFDRFKHVWLCKAWEKPNENNLMNSLMGRIIVFDCKKKKMRKREREREDWRFVEWCEKKYADFKKKRKRDELFL